MENNTGKLCLLGSAYSAYKNPDEVNVMVHVIDMEENKSAWLPTNTVALILQELRFMNHESLNSEVPENLIKILVNNKIYLCPSNFLQPFKE